MGTLEQYTLRRHALYKTQSAREADSEDLRSCESALAQLDSVDRKIIEASVEELAEIRKLGPDSALRLLGAVGRFLAENPAYVQARIEGKVKPNGS